MKIAPAYALALLLTGCTPASRSPDAIRQDTAAVTAAAARNAKAVAQGVYQGLRTKGPLNINRASIQELQALPGIDTPTSRRIIAGRPYETGADLQKRHILTKKQYDRIAAQIAAR